MSHSEPWFGHGERTITSLYMSGLVVDLGKLNDLDLKQLYDTKHV